MAREGPQCEECITFMKQNITARDLPYLSSKQMIEVDRAMTEHFHIDLIQMMENVGRNLAQLARQRFLGGCPVEKRVIVLAGGGGNGGGALVAARHLHNWGARPSVFLGQDADRMTPVATQQLDILSRMRVDILSSQDVAAIEAADVVLDGLIGYSLRGAPKDPIAGLIRWANSLAIPILALDTPSGIDTTTGAVSDPAIRATATMTLALPKLGLRIPGAFAHVGELYLADIGVPAELYALPPLNLSLGPIFSAGDIIRLW